MSAVSDRPNESALDNFLAGRLSVSQVEQIVVYLNAHPEVLAELADKRGRDVLERELRTLAEQHQGQADLQSLVVHFQATHTEATQTNASNQQSDGVTIPSEDDPNENPLAFLSPPQAPGEIGRLGDYRILRQLGEGGMGMVFEAEDSKLKRRVALKVMKPKIAEKKEHRQRFLREAQVAAQVEHDHICPIYQIGEENKVPFIAMPFLKGEALNTRLKREKNLPLAEVIRIGRELAEGLAAAHDANLIHRDIKPANIWLETVVGKPNRVRILDFGLARLQTEEVHLTTSGTIVGTPAYMSPEQARAKELDHRTDLFSLGVVLYEMCTGMRPFSGKDTMSILTSLAADEPTPPEKYNPQIPRGLSRLLMQLLAKRPEQRPATARAVVEALRGIEMQSFVPVVEALPVTQSTATSVDPWQNIDVDTESSLNDSIPVASIPEMKPTPKKSSLKWVLIALGVLFPLLLILGGVYYISTDNGMIELKTTDKNVKVVLEEAGGKITILDPQSKQQWVVNTGKYTIKLDSNPDGLEIDLPTDREFEMKRGGKMVVSIRKTDKVIVGKDPKDKEKDPPIAADPDREAAKWVLSTGGKVRVNGEENDITDVKKLPKAPYRLTAFRIESEKVTDEDLKIFEKCTNIERVIFSGTRLKGTGLTYLKNNKKITLFDFYYNSDHDPKLPNLKDLDFSHLENLVFQGSYVLPEALDAFKECTKIKAVNLFVTKLTTGCGVFQKCTDLEVLFLTGITDIKDKDLSALLSGKSKLRFLDISSTNISDAGLVGIEGHTQFKGLQAKKTKVTDKSLELLAKIPSLNQLNLEYTEITNKGLSYLENHKNINSLLLSNTKISDEGLQYLSKIEFWDDLQFGDTSITDKGLEHLKKCKSIQHLGLRNTKITDKGLLNFEKINMRLLDVQNTNITDEAIPLLKSWTNLQELKIKGTKITPAGIAELKKALPECKIEHDELPIGALEFDGKNSRVEIPTLKMDAKVHPAFTFEVWVKPDTNENRENQTVSLLGGPVFGLRMHVQKTKDERVVYHYQMEANRAPGVASSYTGLPNQFVHIAGVYDGKVCHLYIGGRLSASHKMPTNEPYSPTPIELGIGRNFKGEIRGVRITNGVRYTKDFLPEERFTADKETLALYLFDEKEGDKLTDSSGNNHHGKIIDAKWIAPPKPAK